jgi:hypothetical protein
MFATRVWSCTLLLCSFSLILITASARSYSNHSAAATGGSHFEENLGQFIVPIRYQTYTANAQVRFLDHGLSFALVHEILTGESEENREICDLAHHEEATELEALVWNMTFVGMNPATEPRSEIPLPGAINYFRGSDPSQWVTGVSRYGGVWYDDLYDQIDLHYYHTGQAQLKYDFVLRPGAEVGDIQLRLEGIEELEIASNGDLLIHTAWGTVREAAPYTYQDLGSKRNEIASSYVLLDAQTVGFALLGNYHAGYPVVIDPVTLDWGTFLHTATSDDYLMAIDRDAQGNLYATGYTKAANFPVTPGIYQNTYGGGIDSYVIKISGYGDALVYASYLGGTSWELGYGIGVNDLGEAYVCGYTSSTDYPTTTNAFQASSGGGLTEGFLARISADGTQLLTSTYLGGSDRDYIYDLKVNGQGVYLTGYSLSADFPATADAFSQTQQGNGDAFVTHFKPDARTLVYSTLFGGNSYDIANGMALNAANEVYVTGATGSANLPTTVGSLQPTANFVPGYTAEDAFLFRLSADGSSLIYATYLGGTDSDGGYSVDINSAGEAFIAGTSYSTNFPVSAKPFMAGNHPQLGNGDTFAARISADGSSLLYGTYIGGSDGEYVKSIRINEFDEAFMVGATRSPDFPIDAMSASLNGNYDLYVAVLSGDGSTMSHCAVFGGSYNEYPRASGALVVNGSELYIGATSHSPTMPATGGVYQSAKLNGVADAPWIAGMNVGTILPTAELQLRASWNRLRGLPELDWQTAGLPEGSELRVQALTGENVWETVLAATELNGSSYDARQLSGPSLLYRLEATPPNGATLRSASVSLSVPEQLSLRLFPNPADQQLEIRGNLPAGQALSLEAVDLQGRRLYQASLPPMATSLSLSHPIPTASWPAGIYWLKVQFSGQAPQLHQVVVRH